jgi:hypothetical protein
MAIKSRPVRILLGILSVLAVLMLGFYVYIIFFFDLFGPCSEEEIIFVDSRQGKSVTETSRSVNKADAFIRNCGATTGFSTVVRINGEQAVWFKGYHDKDNLRLSWVRDDALRVELEGTIRDVYMTELSTDIEVIVMVNGEKYDEEKIVWN